jgi:hypothetical protein
MLILVISYLVSDRYLQGIVRIFFMKKTSVTIFMPFEALEGATFTECGPHLGPSDRPLFQ